MGGTEKAEACRMKFSIAQKKANPPSSRMYLKKLLWIRELFTGTDDFKSLFLTIISLSGLFGLSGLSRLFGYLIFLVCLVYWVYNYLEPVLILILRSFKAILLATNR